MKTPLISRLFAASLALAAFVLGAPLLAQQGTGPIPTGTGNYGPAVGNSGAHIIWSGGPPPSLNSACGTAPSAPNGTDSVFSFSSGTGTNSGCVVTFNVPWKNPPVCSVDGTNAVSYTVSTTGINMLGVLDSQQYMVICIGRAGG